jgi:ectoine hydroxylase-related dioxygenase (phytanoyl-CoA dioxygenase family)
VTTQEWSALNHQFLADGAVCIRGALDDASMRLAEEAYNWSLEHATSHQKTEGATGSGRFFQDFFNPDALPHYRRMLLESAIPEVLTSLWDSPDLWFMFEHVFLKDGPQTRPTSWHQDSQDLPVEGSQFATVWISFDPIARAEALELIRGSHWGVRFAAAARPDPDAILPPVPDIDAHRERYEMLSWSIEPGDLLVFHPAMLHGGAPTRSGGRRRTLSLRFFGKDAVYAPRPGNHGKVGPANFGDGALELQAGDPFRHPAFPRVRPSDEAEIDAAIAVRKAYSPLTYAP